MCFRAWGDLPAELQPGFLNRLQEVAYIHGEAWDGGTGQPRAGAVERALGEVSVARLAVGLDLPLPPQHQPAFFHAGAGVGAQLGALLVIDGAVEQFRSLRDQPSLAQNVVSVDR